MILISDTETTGVTPQDQICEVAFLEVDVDLNILSSFQSLVKPSIPISPQASASSHITNKMVEDAPSIAEAFASCSVDFTQPLSLVAHNSQFDRRFLAPHWNIDSELCTLKVARLLYPQAPDHKLQTLRYYLELEIDAGAHRAMEDVKITYALLKRMCSDFNVDLQELFLEAMKPRVIEVMPFGKFKGCKLKNLSKGYVSWLLNNATLDKDLEAALRSL